MSPLFLFRRQQDFAYQQEVAGSPSKRHHVRFWKCPDGWLLPGGFAVDWLAAGTYDRRVGLSLFTLQVTHKIDPHVDDERDHIISTIRAAEPAAVLTTLSDYFTGYHSRNGGGDLIETDGHLPIVNLTRLEVEPEPPAATPVPTSTRPTQVMFAVVVTGLRALSYLGLGALLFLGRSTLQGASPDQLAAVTALAVVALAGGVADVVLGVCLYRGHNWARLALAALSVIGLAATFVTHIFEDPGPLGLSLVPLAISVLLLFALSSEAARDFSTSQR